MKKIAILTDFSERSINAAAYGISLATALRANVVLFNSFRIPSAEPTAAQIAWPMEDYAALKAAADEELETLAAKFTKQLKPLTENEFCPRISCRAAEGYYNESVDEWLADKEVILLVMANHHSGLSGLITGNHTSAVLDHATLPVLIVPESAHFQKPARIAFTTDLSRDDVEVTTSLAGFARHFNAEILLAHICNDEVQKKKQADEFLLMVTNNVNYPKIYYRRINETNIKKGLELAAAECQADLLVMVHRSKDFLNRLFNKSFSQRMAAAPQLPLLIFPYPVSALPVF